MSTNLVSSFAIREFCNFNLILKVQPVYPYSVQKECKDGALLIIFF